MSKPAASKPVKPVILCGGSGTRLWPLSRKSFPKQFVPLIGNKSLLQLTLERLALLGSEIVCVASDEHRFLVSECMQAANVKGTVLLEPVARNTAPAMALAALSTTADELLLFCPADHWITDVRATIDELGIQISLVPSRIEESFGLVAIESMACSCLTLGSERGALSEISRITGMLTFDIDAPLSLDTRLRELLLSDAQNLHDLARRQHRHATEQYALTRFRRKVAHLLTNL